MKSTAVKKASARGSLPASSSPTSARLLKGRPLDQDAADTADTRPKSAADLTAKQLLELHKTPVELHPDSLAMHPDLLAKVEDAVRPVAVQNGRMHAIYLGLHLERDKDKKKLVHLDFSFALEEAHDGYLPRKVKEAWQWLKESENKLVQVQGIDAATIDVFSDPRRKDPLVHLVGAEFVTAVVKVVEETGKGKSIMVTRFLFRVRVERNDEIIHFGAWRDGEEFWICMPSTQGEIA